MKPLRLLLAAFLAGVVIASCGRPFEPRVCLRWARTDTVYANGDTASLGIIVSHGGCVEYAE